MSTTSSSSSSSGSGKKGSSEHEHGLLKEHHSQAMKISAAAFYGIASILVIFSNKAVMTNYNFHHFDFLATVQFIVTTIILLILILLKRIDVPLLSLSICKEILPVTLMFLGNVLCGLGSTKSLNIPMFTALRRFSILMTMLGEWFLLGAKPSNPIFVSVGLMVGGSMVAAFYDLAFDLEGYTLVFLNNIFTALNGVYMKKASVSGKCSKMGVLFYNSLFSGMIMMSYFVLEHAHLAGYFSPAYYNSSVMSAGQQEATEKVAISALQSMASNSEVAVNLLRGASEIGDAEPMIMSTLSKVYAFEGWADPTFLAMFFGAACMGSVLNYSIFLCTTVNSPLTTAVVGATKNVATTYIGMFAFSDYKFTWINFVGINISIFGSLYYTYMILFKGQSGFGGV